MPFMKLKKGKLNETSGVICLATQITIPRCTKLAFLMFTVTRRRSYQDTYVYLHTTFKHTSGQYYECSTCKLGTIRLTSKIAQKMILIYDPRPLFSLATVVNLLKIVTTVIYNSRVILTIIVPCEQQQQQPN